VVNIISILEKLVVKCKHFCFPFFFYLRSVSIALSYGLDDQGSRVQFLVGAGNFSLHHHVQNSSGAHQASYPMGTRSSFPGGKEAGA
jgi:hypothetical protein